MHTAQANTADKLIVEKIRKLLALADSNKNSHEHERNVAMQAAMDLLAKHNLSMAHIDKATLDIEPEEATANFRLEPWIRSVISAACTLYYTSWYMRSYRHWDGRIDRQPVFVGTEENITVTIDMAGWLINSIRLESNRLYKDAFERRSFRLGAADRVFARALELVRKEEESAVTTPGTSLMVIRNKFEKANDEHMSKKNLSTFKPRAVYLNLDAFADGESFGNQVGLDRQLNGGRKRLHQF